MRVMPLKQEVSNNSFVLLSPFLQEDNQIFCHCTGGMNAITKDNYEDVYKSCDTIDGQYTEFDAIRCPHCLIENRW